MTKEARKMNKLGGYALLSKDTGNILWHTLRQTRRNCWEAIGCYTEQGQKNFSEAFRIIPVAIEPLYDKILEDEGPLVQKSSVPDLLVEFYTSCEGIVDIEKALEFGYSKSKYNKGQWIPIEEGLPEEDGGYLTTMENGGVAELYLSTLDFLEKDDPEYGLRQWEAGGDGHPSNIPIIAWMKLPEGYKREKPHAD